LANNSRKRITNNLPSSRAASLNEDLYPTLLPQNTHIRWNLPLCLFSGDTFTSSILPIKVLVVEGRRVIQKERKRRYLAFG